MIKIFGFFYLLSRLLILFGSFGIKEINDILIFLYQGIEMDLHDFLQF